MARLRLCWADLPIRGAAHRAAASAELLLKWAFMGLDKKALRLSWLREW
ncbi:hypothetical protein pfor_17c1880 [Rhodobacteraceae bacterium SB2]|jgi:hypothetical protein|nr:hypothetical protein pfor_17c1880 [Rhodobacteraceae bacterium SB2]